MSERSSYKSLFKTFLVYGSAQVVQMLMTILRAKFIAIFLGSSGMGVNAILQSTITAISNFTSFGIFQSAVRDISQSKENHKTSYIISVFNRIVFLLGIGGTILCIILSPWLSRFAFNTYDKTWYFIVVSVSVLFMALSNGQNTILQGTRNLKLLAKSTIVGAVVSLIVVIPFYYFLGINGIPISLVLGYLVFYSTRRYYTNRLKIESVKDITIDKLKADGKSMLLLGSVLMLGTVMISLFSYAINIFISRFGSINDVGFFQGASSITTQSIVIVMSILASDFFPRLSSIHTENGKIREALNQQAELVTIIIAPIILFLLVFAPFVIKVLLSSDFLVICLMLRSMALALLFRGIWIIMSYVILAKGDKVTYFVYDALLGNGLIFVLNVLFYRFWGLNGLGYSFFIGSIIATLILTSVVFVKYKIGFTKNFYYFFFKIFLLLFVIDQSFSWIDGVYRNTTVLFCSLILFVILFNKLNQRLNVKDKLIALIKK